MKKQRLFGKIIALSLALCAFLSLLVPAYAANGSSAQSWMADIDGSLTLAQFTVPGTHDSCTQYCLLGRCQHVGIREQMNMGVRFLDIRLKNNGGKLNCYHSFINCLYSFDSVMKAVSSFLKAHPSECIIMSIKNEDEESADFESVLVNQWIDSGTYKNLFYTEDRIPTLDEVRGRIVLLRRYTNYSQSLARGIDARGGWSDNNTSHITRRGYTLKIQDIYSYDTIGLTFGNKKWKNFSAFDKAIAGNDPDTLYLNFASGCNSIGCGQLSCAVTVNNSLRKEFAKATGNHGIVIMDYVDHCLVSTVYAVNFRK